MEVVNFQQAVEELKKKNMTLTKSIGKTNQTPCEDFDRCFLKSASGDGCYNRDLFVGCKKRDLLVRENLIKANIPKRFLETSFETVLGRGVPNNTEEQSTKIISFVNEIKNISTGKGLILKGSVGTMKTTLAICVLNFWIDSCGSSGMFINMSSLLDNIFTLKAASPEDWAKYESRIKKTPLLVLDDLGAEYTEGWVLTKVDSIISERYNNCLSTIVTTNLSSEVLNKTYARRVIDRLSSTCEVINFDGPSLRPKIGG